MKYLIWKNNGYKKNKDDLLNVLLTNSSFADVFEGENPLHPVGGMIRINHKRYKITRFEKMDEDMIEIVVILATEGVSETA